MTKDMILVPREYDGEECGECRRVFLAGKVACELFHDEIKGNLRCPSCLATPPARVLTEEMMEAVKNAADFLAKSDDKYNNSGPFWGEELRSAFGIEEVQP